MRWLFSILSCVLATLLALVGPAACCCAGPVDGAASKTPSGCCSQKAKAGHRHDDPCCKQDDRTSCCDKKDAHTGKIAGESKGSCCKANAPCQGGENPARPPAFASGSQRQIHDHSPLALLPQTPTWTHVSEWLAAVASVGASSADASCQSLLSLACMFTI